MIEDDDDMTAVWRGIKQQSQAKRSQNRETSPELLTKAGIKFHAFNETHLRVADQYDFWPGTGLWIHIKTKKKGRGVMNLIKRLK